VSRFSKPAPPARAKRLQWKPAFSSTGSDQQYFSSFLTIFYAILINIFLSHFQDIRHQWAIVFYISAGVNLLGMTFYLCFGTSEKQAWADH
jgi:hypothetical protein